MRHGWAFLVLLSGCDLFGTVRPSGKPVSEAYGGSHELRVLDTEVPLRPQKKIPVLSTPEVFAAYVPAHATPDLLTGDHWIYFRLSEPTWYHDRLQDPEPPSTGDAPPELMRPLRDAEWDRIVVPRRN